MDEIQWCYHSNETSLVVLSHGAIYLVCNSNFWIYGWNTMVLPFKWNFFGSTFTWCYLFCSILQIEIWIFCPLSTIFGGERVKKKNKYVFLDYRQKIERMGNQWKYKYWRGFESLRLLSFQNKITLKIIQQRKLICIHSFLAYVVHGSGVSPYYMFKTLLECYFSSSMEERIHFRARYKTWRKKS